MLLAGAAAVGLASAVMLRGYDIIPESLRQLDLYLSGKGLTCAELIGRAADARRSFAEMAPRPDNWRRYIPKPGSDPA
jgi:dihydroorotate dehydrogenase (NAD+) catalytic subunit